MMQSERLILRPWQESDAVQCFLYAKDEKIGSMAGWPPHQSLSESLQIIKDVLIAPENYAICLKDDNLAIGSIGLFKPKQQTIVTQPDELEIGYWLGVPFWGQGLVPEAVSKLQEHAFMILGCTKLWCAYIEGNDNSKRVQEKCGFLYHHTEKETKRILLGDTKAFHFTCLTKEQWLSREK